MSSSKLSGALPGPDANGLLVEVAKMIADFELGSKRVVPAIILLDVKGISIDEDREKTATIRIRRIELVHDDDRGVVERVAMRAYERRTGKDVLPWDLEQDVKKAFAGLDADELARESMTDADELRAHLRVVHQRSNAEAYTDTEAADEHLADHDNNKINHPTAWTGWTALDLAEQPAHQSTRDDDTDVPQYLLYWTTANGWRLRHQSIDGEPLLPDQTTDSLGLGDGDVAEAHSWAAGCIKDQVVVRWAKSDQMPGAWYPILADGDPT